MTAFLPPLLFVLSWVFALIGWNAPGAEATTPFEEQALRWILFLAVGWTGVGAVIPHTIFARATARSIGWETNPFQYEVGFANLAIGLGGIYASQQDEPSTWIVAAIGAGVFLALAGLYHVVEIFRNRNFAPGNTAILISDFGIPISLLALVLAISG